MTNGRRVNERRRRVLYSAQQAETPSPSAASRSAAIRLREARRPQAAYGSRVHRRLRGRWFSLVPVHRRALLALSITLVSFALLLCLGHYVAVTWPSIAYRSELARPLRLDRPDSFGQCMMLAMLSLSTGVSLLIYQLRRYRNDDYKGHYRLWRLVLVVMCLASINAMVGMIDWGGAVLDAVFGKRVALTGSDWIRLVVSFGAAVLAIRLVAEVRQCRGSLIGICVAWLLLATPEAAKWNVLTVDSLSRWMLVTCAPLLGSTALFLSLGIYLRMLYREVRQIEDSEPLLDRLSQLRARWFRRSANDAIDEEAPKPLTSTRQAGASKSVSAPKEGRWFSLRLKPPTVKSNAPAEARTTQPEPSAGASIKVEMNKAPEAAKQRGLGLARFWRGKSGGKSGDGETDIEKTGEADSNRNTRAANGSTQPPSQPVDNSADAEDIDWESLNKSERRRLRKQLKRHGRAA